MHQSKKLKQMLMKKIIFLSSILFMLHLTVVAQTDTHRVNARQKSQHVRVVEGRASGELTRSEARALKAEQRHIRRVEKRAKADGVVTKGEKAKLSRKQNKANRHIRRQKHDEQERGDY